MFSQWVISIVGVVFLSVLADIVLPQGQTNKYIKSIFAIVTVFVIVSPLPTLFDSFADQTDLLFEQQTVSIDDSFLNQLVESKQIEQQNFIEKLCNENGILNIKSNITINFDEGKYKIDLIEIYIKNAVIQNEDKNINIKEKLQQLIVDACGVSKERVVFYE